MELLGIGENMQGFSNCSNVYFTADLNEIIRSCTWPQTSEDKMINGGHDSKGFLSPLSAGLYLGYSREALKQIMLKQEAMFRDQIHELHRLYDRQMEFINELKRGESRRHDISYGRSQSDLRKSHGLMLSAQDGHDIPVYSESLISGEEKTLPSTEEKRMPADPNSVLNEISSNNPYLSVSKSKIWGKEMFDLELPADNEHLSEKDGISLLKKLKAVPKLACHDLKRTPEIVHIGDRETFFASYDLNGSLCMDFLTTNPLFKKTKILVDLNDPLNFEEEPESRSDDMVDANSGNFESSGPCDSCNTYQHVPDKDVANSSSSSTTYLKKSAQEELTGSHISVTESSKTLTENLMLTEDKLSCLKKLRSRIVSDSVSLIEGSSCNDFKSESVRAESHPSFKVSENWLEGQLDLNICINEEFLPKLCSNEIKLEVPVSPTKERHSSPRGEFDDSQAETHLLKPVQEDGKPLEDLIRIAAEALVFISSSVVQNCPESTSCQSAQASWESLCWFARIVSSVGGDPEKVEVESNSKDAGGSEELLQNCMDDFEVMTLNLTETKVEGYSLPISDQEERKNGSLFSSQLEKGHARRSQRKNFQTEVLPSLSTLSRYEVTEDIQTIGGLMEAGCSQSITSLVKSASKSRAVSARGKRRSCNSTTKITENAIGSVMDHISSGNGLGIEERNVIVWGNITRRRRGQRYPTWNQKIISG